MPNVRIIAKGQRGDSLTKLKVNFAPSQSSTPSLMPETNSVYLTRPTEGTGELMELVGGSVAWNQLCNSSSVTGTSGHKFYLKKSGVESITNTNTFTGLASGTDMVTDITQMLGPTIADYVYNLEQATAGSGIAWLKSYGFFTEDYYAYSAPTLQSVEATSHIAKDGNGNVISTTTFGSVTLRGIPMKDADGNLYFNGDTYEWDGTVTRKYAEVDLGTLTWNKVNTSTGHWRFGVSIASMKGTGGNSTKFKGVCTKYIGITPNESYTGVTGITANGADGALFVCDESYSDAAAFKTAMSGVGLVYELADASQTTESADPFTAVQTVEDGGTEEFVTTNGVSVGVVGRFANAVPMDGVDSFTVTADDGTTHTYPVTLSEEIYRGYVDMLTGEAVSDMASIAEYNGETISSPWLSSLDVYSLGATPTRGAQVVYPITAEEITATITGDPTELGKVTSASSTEGTVEWSAMAPLDGKCIVRVVS